MQFKTCVITVTYGDRWEFLSTVLTRLLSIPGVSNVIVVNNASVYIVDDRITDDRVTLLNNAVNQGSAGGYSQGMRYAFENIDADFFWLLDDDNLPNQDALLELLRHWQ